MCQKASVPILLQGTAVLAGEVSRSASKDTPRSMTQSRRRAKLMHISARGTGHDQSRAADGRSLSPPRLGRDLSRDARQCLDRLENVVWLWPEDQELGG